MAEPTYAPSVQAEPLPGRPYPRLPEGVTPQDEGADLGQGIENAGQIIQQVQQKATQEANRTAVTAAVAQQEQGANSILYDPKSGALNRQGADALNMAPTVLPLLDAQAKSVAQTLANPKQQDAFMSAYLQRQTEYQRILEQHESTQISAYQDKVDQAGLASSYQTAGLAGGDPQTLARVREDVAGITTNSMERRGITDPQALAEGVQHAYSGMHAAVVRGMITQGNTQGANDYLYGNMQEMDVNTAESLQRLVLNADAHGEAQQNRLLKQGSDALAKQGDDLLAANKLTPAWLHDHRDLLEASEYRYFTNQLTGADAADQKTDPRTYSDLIVRAQNGEDVRDDARTALLAGRLKTTDYAKITGDVASERPGWYKRGAIYLDQALDPGQLNPDPAAHLSKANALQDWQEWATRNPKATDEQARTQQDLIARHYAIVDQNKTTLLMPAPKFLVGTRTAPDLPATSAATMQALADGQITHDQAVKEASLIAQYRATLKAQADAQAAAKKKP